MRLIPDRDHSWTPGNVIALSQVDAGYGTTTVIRGIDLEVKQGSVVALLGANGAGKTTILRAIAGTIGVKKGGILLGGKDISGRPASWRAKQGVCVIPEGRGIYPSLTVMENLLMFTPLRGKKAHGAVVGVVEDAFPALQSRFSVLAGSLSGGEQQMLALSRAYLMHPRLIVLDEVSTGLAPQIVADIYAALRRLAATGVALLIVEQFVDLVLGFANEVYLLVRGTVAWSGQARDVRQSALVASYLGGAQSRSEGGNGAPTASGA
jgi:branched-chain amino acid transport system ATP-binding protein